MKLAESTPSPSSSAGSSDAQAAVYASAAGEVARYTKDALANQPPTMSRILRDQPGRLHCSASASVERALPDRLDSSVTP